jgi:subtilisin family serine protease
LKRGLLLSAVLAAALAAAPALARGGEDVEVVVRLEAPPLAQAVAQSRALSANAKRARLRLATPTSRSYLGDLGSRQEAVEARIRRAIPQARVRWRYRLVFNGLALVLPRRRVPELRRIDGIAAIDRSVRYRSRLDSSPRVIGAPFLWAAPRSTLGRGLKIGIIDDGIDQRHPFFDPTGYTMPPGFPKGDAAFTTAKVIVARAFPPPGSGYPRASRPYDPRYSIHGTHVAGIAAGNRGASAPGGRELSGVAPGAYIGNYKVLTVPAASYDGLDGNSPEIAAGIEAAVRDGMDVINLSLGEPEIVASRDLVVRAITGAAAAGVVPTISAGNDFQLFGRGSVLSPGTAARAITAAAATEGGQIASFSSSGPAPLSLALKPDVTAPGVDILSSVPAEKGLWQVFSGTSMAAPHVAGAAALLRERHPQWTVSQIKSALVATGDPVRSGGGEAATTREGGGMINLERADAPLVFTSPTAVSFGMIAPSASAARDIELTDAGGGAGSWGVSVQAQVSLGVELRVPPSVVVPGRLAVSAVARGRRQGEASGFLVLTRGSERRRIPYWLRVASPAITRQPHRLLRRGGTYAANTRGRPALVDSYRYPDVPTGARARRLLRGPEQVFRIDVARPLANFGVRIVSRAPGVRVEPRILHAGNENRLAGYTALPLNFNPYFSSWLEPVPAAGVVLPDRGSYDVVFDSPTPAGAGAFRFRFWKSDTTPPRVRLLTRSLRRGGVLRLAVTDAGSGVWPGSLAAHVNGRPLAVRYSPASRRATIAVARLTAGRHTLVFQASDYQETRNHENVYRILPNTRRIRASFRLR